MLKGFTNEICVEKIAESFEIDLDTDSLEAAVN